MHKILIFCLSVVCLVQASPVSVPDGGTGNTALTAYAVICGGTSSVNPLQSIASLGTSGQLLTSNGASALPSFQAWDLEYAHIYTYTFEIVAPSGSYHFNLNGLLSSNISHSTSVDTDQITINRTGVYLFIYQANGYTENTFAGISVNGVLDTSTTFWYGNAYTICFLKGFCILNITSGDVIRMINPDAALSTETDSTKGSITASIVILQLA